MKWNISAIKAKITVKRVLIASFACIALGVGIIGIIAGCEYVRYRNRSMEYIGLEKRVSEHITMVHGDKAGFPFCRLRDTRTGEFTTPELNHVFLNEQSDDSLVVFRTKDRLRGYVNIRSGQIVIPAQYDRAWNFREGLAAVIQQGEISFINEQGEKAFEATFPFYYDDDHTDYAFVFHDGLCVMNSPANKWGMINTRGEWVVEPRYNSIYATSLGYRIVIDGDRYGLMARDGQLALPVEYDLIRTSSNSRGFIVAKDGYAWEVDSALQTVTPFVYDRLHEVVYVDNYEASSDRYLQYDISAKSGVIDRQGNVIIPAKYYCIRMVGEDLFEVEETYEGDRFLMDNKGRYIGKSTASAK